MTQEIERFSVYPLSNKARAIIKEGSRTVTLIKKIRINPIATQEISLRINGDELAVLFHVLNMRTLTEDALKAITDKQAPQMPQNGGDENAAE